MKIPFPRERSVEGRNLMTTNRHHVLIAPYPPSVTDTAFSMGRVGEYRYMSDVVTPGFAKIKADGGIVNNTMRKTRDVRILGLANVVQTRTHPVAYANAEVYTYQGSYNGFFDDVSVVGLNLGLAENLPLNLKRLQISYEAALKARNKVNPVLVQSIVSIAEIPKTIALLTRALRDTTRLMIQVIKETNQRSGQVKYAGQIFDTINGIKKGQSGRGSQAVSGAASRYLEWRYGWRILLLEIQGILKALGNKRLYKPRETARGNVLRTNIGQVSRSANFGPSGTGTYTFMQSETCDARAYVLYEADLAYQSARDFGCAEIPLAIWELIPFSFVVDWFINIGAWLEALTPKVGIHVLAEGVTVRHYREVQRQCTGYVPLSSGTDRYIMTGVTTPVDTLISESVERSNTLSSSLLYPRINVKIDVKRALDAIALVVTGYRRSSMSSIRI